jgi:murein DD-endopeptidase MepM/ murein hydrolase activator NlpD
LQETRITLDGFVPDRHTGVQKDKELRKACKDFESVLMHQLLKTMRRTIEKCRMFHGGHGEEIYESILDMELSKIMAGLGPNSLSNLLYEQLKALTSHEGEHAILHERDIRQPNTGQALWPVEAPVSSEFGWRKDPIDGMQRFHNGLDLAAAEGSPVRAALPGRVVFSGQRHGYGNVVIVEHEGDLKTTYAHNKRNLVYEGDWIRGGSVIAEVGRSGRATGAHLHFEIRRGPQALNPLEILPPV